MTVDRYVDRITNRNYVRFDACSFRKLPCLQDINGRNKADHGVLPVSRLIARLLYRVSITTSDKYESHPTFVTKKPKSQSTVSISTHSNFESHNPVPL